MKQSFKSQLIQLEKELLIKRIVKSIKISK